MQPVTVELTIPRSREDVYALLSDLPAHEAFTDHFITNWRTTERGMLVNVKGGGDAEIRPIETTPDRIVEHGYDPKSGEHLSIGTYTLTPNAAGGTDVSFTNELVTRALPARLTWPLARIYLRRQNGRALERLREQLAE